MTKLAAIAALAMAISTVGADPPKKATRPVPLKVGDEAVIRIVGDEVRLGGPGVESSGLVAEKSVVLPSLEGTRADADLDSSVLRAFAEARKAGDRVGVGEILETGRGVRARAGDRVLVLKRGEGTNLAKLTILGGMPVGDRGICKVRILDGPGGGKVGWVPIRNLAPPAP